MVRLQLKQNVIQTEGAHHVKASELLLIYRRRQSGYETGLLKYGIDLYECVCLLTERLAQLLPDTEIRIQSVRARTVFFVAETGTELVAMPEDTAFNGEARQ